MHEMNLQCMLSSGKKRCFAHFCKLVDRTYLFTCNLINSRRCEHWGMEEVKRQTL